MFLLHTPDLRFLKEFFFFAMLGVCFDTTSHPVTRRVYGNENALKDLYNEEEKKNAEL